MPDQQQQRETQKYSRQPVKVWDALVRIVHWVQALAIAVAWLSSVVFGWTAWHQPAGYIALTTVTMRIIWGFTGSHYARFRQFVLPASQVANYWRALRQRCEPTYLGHNPLGGWMVVALLVVTALTGVTGWLFTTDAFWGTYWLAVMHETLAWLLLLLVIVHVFGVIFTSRRHGENLVAAMFSGYKHR